MHYNINDYIAEPSPIITSAIQSAIDAAYSDGGGVVEIPAGTYMTGTFELKSNVTLYLDPGAVLKGSPNMAHYREVGFHHNEMGHVKSLIYAMNAENIRIAGDGIIDLNGESFYDFSRRLVPEYMEDKITPEQREECTLYHESRPNQPIFFCNCRNIRVQEIIIRNAPCWTMAFIESQNIKVLDLDIQNSLIIPNNDGMHFCSCKDVIVRGCKIVAGDDCISITGITDWDKPSENFVISDCILTSCSKTIVMGYMHSIIRNITITNIVMRGCNRGICFMASTGTGLVENINISNVYIETRVRAGNWWGNGEAVLFIGTYHHAYGAPVPERGRQTNIRAISFQNITCDTENAIGIIGGAKNIADVTFSGLKVRMKQSDNIALKGRICDIAPSEQTATIPQDGNIYWMVAREARDITFSDVTVHAMEDGYMPKYAVINCENVRKDF